MQLPVAPPSSVPAPDALLRALLSAEVILGRTMAQETQLDGATVFTNPQRPAVHMANCARMVRLPDGTMPASVVEQVLAYFSDAGVTCHQFSSATANWPAELAQEIETHGYHLGEPCDLYLLRQRRPPGHALAELQIIPGRAAYAEFTALCRDAAASMWNLRGAQAEQYSAAHTDQLDEPHLESFLGRLEGKPAGIVNVLSAGPVGVIDWVYTTPTLRGRGVASRLLDHALDYCQRAQFAQVILEAQRGAPACTLYESLGFAAVVARQAYGRPGSEL
jgi:GNAT superfamily N-acetyltransferase